MWFPAVAALVVTHNRFILAVGVMLVIVSVAALAGTLPRVVAAVNAGAAALLLIAATVLRSRLVDARWVDGIETPQGPTSDAVEVFTSLSRFGRYVLEVFGQLWYVAVGTLGIGLLGVITLTRLLAGSASRRAGLRAWVSDLAVDARRLTVGFVLCGALGVLAVSSYFFFRVTNGSEGFIAGRHNDSFVPIWVGAGAAFVASERRRARLRGSIVLAAGLIVALALLLVLIRDRADWESVYSVLNVPAVAIYGGAGAGVVPIASAVALGTLAVIAAASAIDRPAMFVVPFAVAWMVVAVTANFTIDRTVEAWTFPARFNELDVDRAAVVLGRNSGMPVYYPYFLPDLEAIPWDGRGRPPHAFVLATVGENDVEQYGARIVLVDEDVQQGFEPPYDYGLWVMPGPELNRLERQGLLSPLEPVEG